MSDGTLSLVERLVLAFVLPWRVLFDGALAGRVARAADGKESMAALPASPVVEKLASVEKPERAAEPPKEKPPAPVDVGAHERAGALHMLAILQREARLVDFFMEDVASFSDAEVGAAVRVVHEGGKKIMKDYVTLAPVRTEAEDARVTVEKGFDPASVRLTGNVAGEPPYTGRLAHKGWRVVDEKLPVRGASGPVSFLHPAEIEIA